MKPSPENTMPSAKFKRHLDLYNVQKEKNESQIDNNVTTKLFKEINNANDMILKTRTDMKYDSKTELPQLTTNLSTISDQRVPPVYSHIETKIKEQDTKNSYLKSSVQSNAQDAISAFENRRLSNQLARAQFLASGPSNSENQNSFFEKRFRARSESPQHAKAQNVTRSPSAPTLETAL